MNLSFLHIEQQQFHSEKKSHITGKPYNYSYTQFSLSHILQQKSHQNVLLLQLCCSMQTNTQTNAIENIHFVDGGN